MKTTTGQNFLDEIKELQCIIAARQLSSGWECIVFKDKHEFVYYMSDKYDFELETGDRYYWESLMGELPDELDNLLEKHVYVSGWSFFSNDYEFSKDHDDINEFNLLKDQFLCGAGLRDIFTIQDAIQNNDVRYNTILSKALMTMLEEGIDFEYKSEKYIEVE